MIKNCKWLYGFKYSYLIIIHSIDGFCLVWFLCLMAYDFRGLFNPKTILVEKQYLYELTYSWWIRGFMPLLGVFVRREPNSATEVQTRSLRCHSPARYPLRYVDSPTPLRVNLGVIAMKRNSIQNSWEVKPHHRMKLIVMHWTQREQLLEKFNSHISSPICWRHFQDSMESHWKFEDERDQVDKIDNNDDWRNLQRKLRINKTEN